MRANTRRNVEVRHGRSQNEAGKFGRHRVSTLGQGGAPAAVGTVWLTLAALLAFAANSLLCRLALGRELIDAASFSTVRVVAGAVLLLLLTRPRWRATRSVRADPLAALMLFLYMVFFSFAYLSLDAGTGALVLFGAVQLTMFAMGLKHGERFTLPAWTGLAIALGGLVYLVSPGVTAPDPLGAGLMVVAGVAWGAYSLLGQRTADALQATSNNFLYCVPLVVVVSLIFWRDRQTSPEGLLLAAASGAIASALGYAVWYAALRGLTATRAATLQLAVPVIAAFGGVLLLSEAVTLRLLLASAATLGGIAVVLTARDRVH